MESGVVTNSDFTQLFHTMDSTDYNNYTAENRLRLLRGALCEYLDEGLQDQLYLDMHMILIEERDKFESMAANYQSLLHRLKTP